MTDDTSAHSPRLNLRGNDLAPLPVQCGRTWVHAMHQTTEGDCPGLDAEQVRQAHAAADRATVSGHIETPWGPAQVAAVVSDVLGPRSQEPPEDPWANWYVAPDAEGTLTVWDGSHEPARALLNERARPALWAKVSQDLRVMVEEPGPGAVVEASCPHSDTRRRWALREDGYWHPIDEHGDHDGDAYTDLIDQQLLLAAEEG